MRQAAEEDWVIGPLGAGHAVCCCHCQCWGHKGGATDVLAGGAAPQGADKWIPAEGRAQGRVWVQGFQGCFLTAQCLTHSELLLTGAPPLMRLRLAATAADGKRSPRQATKETRAQSRCMPAAAKPCVCVKGARFRFQGKRPFLPCKISWLQSILVLLAIANNNFKRESSREEREVFGALQGLSKGLGRCQSMTRPTWLGRSSCATLQL